VATLPEPRYPFLVTVVDQPMVNAFATPGGFIVILHGLLDRTASAEELAGVLAHEIQRVVHRDTTRAVLRRPAIACRRWRRWPPSGRGRP
jgi:beta-barrel assembly-enhancing protease